MVAVRSESSAMTRQVFEHRQDTASVQASGNRSGDGRNLARLAAIGAVADHRIAAGYRHVGDRQAIDDRSPARVRSEAIK